MLLLRAMQIVAVVLHLHHHLLHHLLHRLPSVLFHHHLGRTVNVIVVDVER